MEWINCSNHTLRAAYALAFSWGKSSQYSLASTTAGVAIGNLKVEIAIWAVRNASDPAPESNLKTFQMVREVGQRVRFN
jgi:hypothetical protein